MSLKYKLQKIRGKKNHFSQNPGPSGHRFPRFGSVCSSPNEDSIRCLIWTGRGPIYCLTNWTIQSSLDLKTLLQIGMSYHVKDKFSHVSYDMPLQYDRCDLFFAILYTHKNTFCVIYIYTEFLEVKSFKDIIQIIIFITMVILQSLTFFQILFSVEFIFNSFVHFLIPYISILLVIDMNR